MMTLVSVKRLLIVVLCFYLTHQDWVEIPQNTSRGKYSNKSGPRIKSIIRYETNVTRINEKRMCTEKSVVQVTTTSTTTAKPILAITTTMAPKKNVTEKKLVENDFDNTDVESDEDVHEEIEEDDFDDISEENEDDQDNLKTLENEAPLGGYALSGLMPYIKHLQERVMKHLPNGISNKIRMLEAYRDNLFQNIGEIYFKCLFFFIMNKVI